MIGATGMQHVHFQDLNETNTSTKLGSIFLHLRESKYSARIFYRINLYLYYFKLYCIFWLCYNVTDEWQIQGKLKSLNKVLDHNEPLEQLQCDCSNFRNLWNCPGGTNGIHPKYITSMTVLNISPVSPVITEKASAYDLNNFPTH